MRALGVLSGPRKLIWSMSADALNFDSYRFESWTLGALRTHEVLNSINWDCGVSKLS